MARVVTDKDQAAMLAELLDKHYEQLAMNDEGDPTVARTMAVLPGASSERMGRGFTDDGSSPIWKGSLQGAQGRGEVVGKRTNENMKARRPR